MKQQYKLLKLILSNIYLLFACGFLSQAQSVSHVWSKSFGSTGADIPYSITAQYPGCVYTVGVFTNTVDFDPGPGVVNLTAIGSADVFILKLDTSGNLIWAKSIGGTGADIGYFIATDTAGGVYVTGQFAGTADLDPGGTTQNVVSKGGADIFVLHLDSAGNYIWGKSIGGSGADVGNMIAVDSSGNSYVIGNFTGVVDFDPDVTNIFNATSGGSTDVFMLKLNRSGNLVWAKAISGVGSDIGRSLTLDNFGNIVITGSFSNITDFDPGMGIANITPSVTTSPGDLFLARYDTAGNYKWAKAIVRTNSSLRESDLAIDNLGNIYLTGSFSDTIDFDPGPDVHIIKPQNSADIFISRFDSLGNFIWVKTFGGIELERITTIKMDGVGDIYMFGSASSPEIDFDPGAEVFNLRRSTTYSQCFILKLDNSGNFRWARQFGGGSSASQALQGYMDLDKLGNIYITAAHGRTTLVQEIPDFDPGAPVVNLPVAGGLDCFVMRWSQRNCGAPTYTQSTITACDSFVVGGYKYITTGNYLALGINANGCDSIVMLDLTIKNSTGKVTTQEVCDSTVFNGKTYKESGIYETVYTNSVGCDSFVSLNLTVYHTSDTINETACTSFTINGKTYTETGIYSIDTTLNGIGCDSITLMNLVIGTPSTITQIACGSFTLNGTSYTSSGVYTQKLTTVGGCDSTITLNLTINNVDASVVKNSATITANATGATYQWVDCNNNYAALPGETGPSFTATRNGNYAVVVTQNNCTDTSECKAVTHLNVKAIGNANAIHVYPNPGSGVYTLSTDRPLQDATVKVMNITGQVVLERKELNGNTFNFDIQPYADGIYIMEIGEAGERMLIKLVKQ